MHWAILIVIAGVMNATVNLGYKLQSAKDNVFLIAACVAAISSICLFSYHAYTKGSINFTPLLEGKIPVIVAGMGFGSAIILVLFVSAFAKGPYAIIDPLLACIYAITSLLIGMIILQEQPGLVALTGVGLYLFGAVLMSQAK